MTRSKEKWRHLVLLILIVLLFLVTPLAAGVRQGPVLLNIVGAAIVIAGSYTLIERKHLFAIAAVLSAVSVTATWTMVATRQHWAVVLSHSCVILLIVFLALTILSYVLRAGKVTADKVFAAICVYLLIGYGWAFAYVLVDEVQQNSFVALTGTARDDEVGRAIQLRYFSFITLTTVGYGDILPRSSAARTLATLEAIVGQIYLAVLVARLVGLHIVHTNDSTSRD